MPTRIHRLATATIAALTVLTACTGDPPPPTPSTQPPSTSQPPTSPSRPLLAPPVKHPLNADAFLAYPCQKSLTEAQRTALGLPMASFTTQVGDVGWGGRGCNFATADRKTIAEVGYIPNSMNGKGLSALYFLKQSRDIWDLWEPFGLDGYPAVIYGKPGSHFECEVAVGLTDTMYFNVRYTYWTDNGGPDPCEAGRNVASAVLSTIKAEN